MNNHYDIFNWYFTGSNDNQIILNGDVCVHRMRHDEFIEEKKKYTEHKVIEKKDRNYRLDHPNSTRYLLYFQLKPTKVIDDNQILCNNAAVYNLINMDAYFALNVERKHKQMQTLHKL